jgi:hypothetical protein
MLPAFALFAGLGCGAAEPDAEGQGDASELAGSEAGTETATDALTSSVIKHVFVIAMENHNASQIYGSGSAPYINNTLLPKYGHATSYFDNLPSLPSEPHYLWLEAGTNAFSDVTFTNDSAPSSNNSTSSTDHLATQIKNASNGVTWRSYQEGMNATTGACPIAASGFYAPKHDPFVFFKDVSGATPSKTNAYCAAHHKPFSSLAADLANNTVASYNFITPDLCNDMHGAQGCPSSNTVKMGDTWLAKNVPGMIAFANAHAGVILIVWDEPDSSGTMPFLVLGPGVKPNHASSTSISHSSVVRAIDRILGLPLLPKVTAANGLSDFFTAGSYP